MIPTYDPNHATEIVALLTDVFKNATTMKTLLLAVAAKTQELEDALLNPTTGYVFLIQLANAVGDTLDKYGAILRQPRNGMNDATYRVVLQLILRVLRSNGLAEDIIGVAALAGPVAQYLEYYPAAFLLEQWNVGVILAPNVVASFLSQTRDGGVRGVYHYSTWAPGNDFEYVSNYGGGSGEGTWGSHYNSFVGGLWVAGASL